MDTWTRLQNGSDIRGVAIAGVEGEPVTLTEAISRTLGRAFADWLAARGAGQGLRVAVGHDSRLSAAAIKQAVMEGLGEAGSTPLDCGLASTPAMFMSTVFESHGYDGAIMLTASHLPFNRNGMKFFTRDGGLEKADIKDILARAAEIGERPDATGLAAESVDLMQDYAAHLVTVIREGAGTELPLKGLRIVVDAGNGAGGGAPPVNRVLRA